jgi:hypothetical protein
VRPLPAADVVLHHAAAKDQRLTRVDARGHAGVVPVWFGAGGCVVRLVVGDPAAADDRRTGGRDPCRAIGRDVAADDDVVHHQRAGTEDPGTAASGLAGSAGQCHLGDAQSTGRRHVDDAIDAIRVDHRPARARAFEGHVPRDVQITGQPGIFVAAGDRQGVVAGRQLDGGRAATAVTGIDRGTGVRRKDRLTQRAVAVCGQRICDRVHANCRRGEDALGRNEQDDRERAARGHGRDGARLRQVHVTHGLG